MEGDTASLRKSAPNWSLAGDKQLLGMLQQIHQSIMTKCHEANAKLDAMVDALDNASVDLQNVNNKFMALSNSQFVESRVYDDDVDVNLEENKQKEEEPKLHENELQKIRLGLQKLESLHEPVQIMDSDSSDDEETSIILKPKEMYSHRPLPYIIGSSAWKSKWHAGLLPEDNDSDSSLSNREVEPVEEYSDSEPEIVADVTNKHTDRTVSSTSLESEMSEVSRSNNNQQPIRSAADVAAELARKLAGPPLTEPSHITIETPEPTTRKVYRMDKPTPATIFPSEPPPLDTDSEQYSDDDIFAELHKKPNQNSYRNTSISNVNNDIANELFGDSFKSDIGNIVDEPVSSVRGQSPLFDDAITTESVTNKSTNKETQADTIKKPIGGISLFGTNKGAESIGAAILKRHQRKSTSDEDNDVSEKPSPSKSEPLKENNKIIEDLFTKPVVKKKDKIKRQPAVNKVDNKPKDKIDLFSDNLFDDIDDIFTSNVVTKPKNDKNTKSIFDDDDLFSDVVKENVKPKDKSDTKSIFDSDDDLFVENDKTLKTEVSLTNKSKAEVSVVQASITEDTGKTKDKKDIKSIFDSDDDLFVENDKTLTPVMNKNNNQNPKSDVKSLFDDNSDDDLFSDAKTKSNLKEKGISDEQYTSFDSKTTIDKVKDDISNFTETDKLVVQNTKTLGNKLANDKIITKQLQSPNLFDDDEIDDLFSTKSTKQEIVKNAETNVEEIPSSFEDSNKADNQDLVLIKDENNTNNTNNNKDKLNSEPDNHDLLIKDENDTNSVKDELISEDVDVATKPETIYNKNTTETSYTQPKLPPAVDVEDVTKNNLTAKNTENEIKHPEENIIKNTSKVNQEEKVIPEFTDEYDKDASIDLDDKQKEPLFSEALVIKSKEPDVFSDIFNDLPPAFDKPSESKKSKNVNALFDDDSDDEALFFKKNEVVNDEEQDLDFGGDRFRIFHDEPPDIDVDFSQKPLKTGNNVVTEEAIDSLFTNIHKKENIDNKYKIDETEQNKGFIDDVAVSRNEPLNTVDITKLLEEFSDGVKQEINISKLLEAESEDEASQSVNTYDTNIPKSESKVIDIIDNIEHNKTETENKDTLDTSDENITKKVGKLKPMNFNINVNTLLPGASPKKTKTNEETDGQIISTKSYEELNIHSPIKGETKMVKSVSFDGDPDSEILDNKLSKERAKIQVKRRPSSRRARLEAVRKSGIDWSDSTDNSSSIDEPRSKEIPKDVVDAKDEITKITKKIDIDKESNKRTTFISDDTLKSSVATSLITDKKQDVKSKIVYILNDEDIFTNTSQNTQEQNIEPSRNNPLEDAKPKIESKSNDKKTETKGTKSLFDDLSDEELFGNKRPAKNKESLFDSDSEGELFSKSKKMSRTEQKETARASLFGDESDENDLFGNKTSKITDYKQTTKPKETTNKPTERVFQDPLSMLGDDDS